MQKSQNAEISKCRNLKVQKSQNEEISNAEISKCRNLKIQKPRLMKMSISPEASFNKKPCFSPFLKDVSGSMPVFIESAHFD